MQHTRRRCPTTRATPNEPARAPCRHRVHAAPPAAPTHSGLEQAGRRPRHARAPGPRAPAAVNAPVAAALRAEAGRTSSGSVPRLDHGTETRSSSAKARSTVVAPPAGMKAACEVQQVSLASWVRPLAAAPHRSGSGPSCGGRARPLATRRAQQRPLRLRPCAQSAAGSAKLSARRRDQQPH